MDERCHRYPNLSINSGEIRPKEKMKRAYIDGFGWKRVQNLKANTNGQVTMTKNPLVGVYIRTSNASSRFAAAIHLPCNSLGTMHSGNDFKRSVNAPPNAIEIDRSLDSCE